MPRAACAAGRCRLPRGRGSYVDDIVLPRMLHAAFVRSPHAHAVVRRIDAARARERELDGVVAVLGPDDLGAAALSPPLNGGGFPSTAWPALAPQPPFW